MLFIGAVKELSLKSRTIKDKRVHIYIVSYIAVKGDSGGHTLYIARVY